MEPMGYFNVLYRGTERVYGLSGNERITIKVQEQKTKANQSKYQKEKKHNGQN
jgi:hypothetical protein